MRAFALLLTLLVPATSYGVIGLGNCGNGVTVGKACRGNAIVAHLPIKQVQWWARSSAGPTSPGPAANAPRLTTPRGGEWVEAHLLLDGIITLTTPTGAQVEIEVHDLNISVPCAYPAAGGTALELDLDVPDWLWSAAPLRLTPGDARYEAAIAAIEDGALLR